MRIQGDPNQNCPFLRAITQKLSLSDPKLVKPKCVWEAVVFFQFLKICLHFSTVCLQFFKKTTTSQTHYGFTNMGSEVLSFWVISLGKGQFWFGSPCISSNYKVNVSLNHKSKSLSSIELEIWVLKLVWVYEILVRLVQTLPFSNCLYHFLIWNWRHYFLHCWYKKQFINKIAYILLARQHSVEIWEFDAPQILRETNFKF